MALNPRDIPISRDEVAQWISDYNRKTDRAKARTSLESYLRKQIADKSLHTTQVNTVGNDSLGDETELLDLIMSDLPSYGYEG